MIGIKFFLKQEIEWIKNEMLVFPFPLENYLSLKPNI